MSAVQYHNVQNNAMQYNSVQHRIYSTQYFVQKKRYVEVDCHKKELLNIIP